MTDLRDLGKVLAQPLEQMSLQEVREEISLTYVELQETRNRGDLGHHGALHAWLYAVRHREDELLRDMDELWSEYNAERGLK